MQFKQVKYRYCWQVIRRFELGVRFYAKGNNEKFHRIKRNTAIAKAWSSKNIYTYCD